MELVDSLFDLESSIQVHAVEIDEDDWMLEARQGSDTIYIADGFSDEEEAYNCPELDDWVEEYKMELIVAQTLDLPFEALSIGYDDNVVVYGSRRVKQGMSPAEYRRDVVFLRRAMAIIGLHSLQPEAVDNHFLLHHGIVLGINVYSTVSILFDRNPRTKAMKKTGTHQLLNTLWWVTESMFPRYSNHSERVLRNYNRAYFNQPIVDDRESYWENSGEYLVLDDYGREEAFENMIDSLIEDVIEIPAGMQNYFDREAFTRDCKTDGYGHHLSGYDGVEHETEFGYYIYRI